MDGVKRSKQFFLQVVMLNLKLKGMNCSSHSALSKTLGGGGGGGGGSSTDKMSTENLGELKMK